jgi:hypothetical protein
MCAIAIVILHVRKEDVAEVSLAEDDDMIKAFPVGSNRSAVQHVYSAMEIAARLVGRECPWREAAV